MSNHMTSILVNMNDRLNKGYSGTDALTRIYGGENETRSLAFVSKPFASLNSHYVHSMDI